MGDDRFIRNAHGLEGMRPEEVHVDMMRQRALLVCAYHSDEKFATNHVDGAVSLKQFIRRILSIAKSFTFIFNSDSSDYSVSGIMAKLINRLGDPSVQVLDGRIDA